MTIMSFLLISREEITEGLKVGCLLPILYLQGCSKTCSS